MANEEVEPEYVSRIKLHISQLKEDDPFIPDLEFVLDEVKHWKKMYGWMLSDYKMLADRAVMLVSALASHATEQRQDAHEVWEAHEAGAGEG